MNQTEQWQIHQAGCIDYSVGLDLQYSAKQQTWPTLIFCSHPPTLTLGRATPQQQQAKAVAFVRQNPQWQLAEIKRGGELTLHTPQQLIVYPIRRLQHPQQVREHLRCLADWFNTSLEALGVRIHTPAPSTGIWAWPYAESGLEPRPYKIGSIGVAVQQWVTLHGVALQVEPHPVELHLPSTLHPCGLPHETYQSVQGLGYTQLTASLIRQQLLEQRVLLDLSAER